MHAKSCPYVLIWTNQNNLVKSGLQGPKPRPQKKCSFQSSERKKVPLNHKVYQNNLWTLFFGPLEGTGLLWKPRWRASQKNEKYENYHKKWIREIFFIGTFCKWHALFWEAIFKASWKERVYHCFWANCSHPLQPICMWVCGCLWLCIRVPGYPPTIHLCTSEVFH